MVEVGYKNVPSTAAVINGNWAGMCWVVACATTMYIVQISIYLYSIFSWDISKAIFFIKVHMHKHTLLPVWRSKGGIISALISVWDLLHYYWLHTWPMPRLLLPYQFNSTYWYGRYHNVFLVMCPSFLHTLLNMILARNIILIFFMDNSKSILQV